MKASPFITCAALLFLVSCNVNVQEGHGSGHPNFIPIDSNTTITTHTEKHSGTKGGFEIKGGFHAESHTTIHTTTSAKKNSSLPEQVDAWIKAIFMDHETMRVEGKMQRPNFKSAKASVFFTLQRRHPITNAYGKSVKPLIQLMAYRFSSPISLANEVETWLNSLGSTQKDIELGQAVTDLKSAPMVCAISGEDLLLVQSDCNNEVNEWAFSKNLFFATFEQEGAPYAWEIKCGKGEIVYMLGGMD